MHNSPISGKDFIVFGLQPWDFEMGSNCKNIAWEFAKHNRVLYVNRPIERSSLYKFRNDAKIKTRLASLRKGAGVLTQVEENIWVLNPRVILESINWLPPGKLHHALNRINAKRLAKEIQWAVAELGFEQSALFIDNDFIKGFYLNHFLGCSPFIYYIRDYLRSQPYFARHGATLEPAYMAKADVVVANSSYLAQYAKKYNPSSYDIGQGCEVEQYAHKPQPLPADMQYIPRPIIGYCGALLCSRLDVTLLTTLAKARSDWNFVLVGPQDEGFKKSHLHNLANVHFLGSKEVAQLPAYIHHFDVCINPQLVNEMTIGNYPRKIDEYLAAGKQVVATRTQAMQLFEEHCLLAETSAQYVTSIIAALSKGKEGADAKIAFAMSHTWEASVAQLYAALTKQKTVKEKVYAEV